MSELEVKEEIAVVLLGDPNDRGSLHNILPNIIVNAAFTVKEEHMSLEDKVILDKLSVETQIKLSRLRESLWLQIHAAHGQARKINNKMVYYGVTSARGLEYQLSYPERVSFLLRPPIDYEIALREALTCSVEQIREILHAPNLNAAGEVDPKIADVKRRIFENLSDRVKGMPVQRTENLNLNKEVGANQDFNTALPTSTEDIDKKLKELERDVNGEKDVTPKT